MITTADTGSIHPDEQGERSGSVQHRPRLLWANAYCLLDTSSGASISVRTMLHQLASRGWEIAILGATVFDHDDGRVALEKQWARIKLGKVVVVDDGALEHQLVVTKSTCRGEMSSLEEGVWFQSYLKTLDSFRPDLIWYYGGNPLDMLAAAEASKRGIPSAFYLANGNYLGSTRWYRDLALIVTDSSATAELYRQKGIGGVVPVGKFIDPHAVVAGNHSRRNLLFVNPVNEKGAVIVVQLALMLEKMRPDILIEVVASRGADWYEFVKWLTRKLGQPREHLDNVVLTPHTNDMRPVYGRARLLLAPSLWWESGPRVAAEAMLNGIPAIVTARGGAPEMIGDAGISLHLPDVCHEAPYDHLPGNDLILSLARKIIRMYDDEEHYLHYVRRAYAVGASRHSIERNTDRLVDALMPLVQKSKRAVETELMNCSQVVAMDTDEGGQPRRPRLLWANAYCLLDTSSGASISVRTMLHQLASRGWEIAILGATVFDHDDGRVALEKQWARIKSGKVVVVDDGALEHQLVVTKSTCRGEMSSLEEGVWFQSYLKTLDSFRPDLVWYYGGKPVDLMVPLEAAFRGIPSAFYLANGNYRGRRWHRDIDLLLTDSLATALYYREKDGINVVPVGTFINPAAVRSEEHSRRNLLFVNPSLTKGAGIVVQLALALGKLRPEIVIEVVESRKHDWPQIVRNVSEKMGDPREHLDNVELTPHTTDMRPVYGRARLLIVPSLAWESGPRVAAEAMLNGIPAIVTARGGAPEMIGDAGISLHLPDVCHEAPYDHLPGNDLILSLARKIIRMYDDEELYESYVIKAYAAGSRMHSVERNVQRLEEALMSVLRMRSVEGVPAPRGTGQVDFSLS